MFENEGEREKEMLVQVRVRVIVFCVSMSKYENCGYDCVAVFVNCFIMRSQPVTRAGKWC